MADNIGKSFRCLIIIFPVAFDPDRSDRAPFRQLPYTHAGISFADFERSHQVFQPQGGRAEINGGINLAERTWKPEPESRASRQIDKTVPNNFFLSVQNILNLLNFQPFVQPHYGRNCDNQNDDRLYDCRKRGSVNDFFISSLLCDQSLGDG